MCVHGTDVVLHLFSRLLSPKHIQGLGLHLMEITPRLAGDGNNPRSRDIPSSASSPLNRRPTLGLALFAVFFAMEHSLNQREKKKKITIIIIIIIIIICDMLAWKRETAETEMIKKGIWFP